MTQDEIEELSFKWTGVRSARNVDAKTFVDACERGDIDFVREALKNNKSLANASKEGNYTALMGAVRNGHTDVAKLLIDSDANINAVNEYRTTPLMFAVGDLDDYPDMVRLLLEAGADVNFTDCGGYTSLDLAEIGGLTRSIAIIKSWGGVNSGQPIFARNSGNRL